MRMKSWRATSSLLLPQPQPLHLMCRRSSAAFVWTASRRSYSSRVIICYAAHTVPAVSASARHATPEFESGCMYSCHNTMTRDGTERDGQPASTLKHARARHCLKCSFERLIMRDRPGFSARDCLGCSNARMCLKVAISIDRAREGIDREARDDTRKRTANDSYKERELMYAEGNRERDTECTASGVRSGGMLAQ